MSVAEQFEFFLARCEPRLRVVGSSFGEAIDLFIGDLARQGKSLSTRRSYERQLNHLARQVRDKPPAELDLTDYETFLNRWTDSKPSTLASAVSLARSFSRFLFERGIASEVLSVPALQQALRRRLRELTNTAKGSVPSP